MSSLPADLRVSDITPSFYHDAYFHMLNFAINFCNNYELALAAYTSLFILIDSDIDNELHCIMRVVCIYYSFSLVLDLARHLFLQQRQKVTRRIQPTNSSRFTTERAWYRVKIIRWKWT